MSSLNSNRWEAKPGPREPGPYYALAPDGKQYGPYEEWSDAYARASASNGAIREEELSDEAREFTDTVLVPLKERGATRIQSEYSGSGDSGEFTGIFVEGAEATSDEEAAVERYFEELLEERHGGWENNEGGNGEFEIDLTTDPLTLEHTHNECYEDYNTSSYSDELTAVASGAER
jgi:hypothetical protein